MKTTTEGPFGFPMDSALAKQCEKLRKAKPASKEFDYQRAYSIAVKGTDDERRTDISVITTLAVDRDREVVVPTGIHLTSFRKNPVVTFAHKYDQPPIGKALWIRKTFTAIEAKTRYSETNPFALQVFAQIKAGELPGKSIGFLPLTGHPPTKAEIAQRPELAAAQWIYDKAILLEYAVVPVQSNPDALTISVSKEPKKAAIDYLTLIDPEQIAAERFDQQLGRI